MKTVCTPGYHPNGFVGIHALRNVIRCHKAVGGITRREYCFHDCVYIYYARLSCFYEI